MSSVSSRAQHQERYSFEDFGCRSEQFTISLKHKNLWEQFHMLGTEMIVTKSGRRMFPAIQVDIKDLEPTALYYIYLEFHLESKCRHKYSSSIGWTPAGHEETQTGSYRYSHPDSPQTGEHWMSQTVSFGRVKLTNSSSALSNHIVLNSMHKYQPKIVIMKSIPSPLSPYPCWQTVCVKAFKETEFIAVTAYQNEKITKLKIDNNPFAKGFRENGKSTTTKRKINDNEEETTSTVSNDSQCPSSPPLSPSNSELSPSSVTSVGTTTEVNNVSTTSPVITLPPMAVSSVPTRYSYVNHIYNSPSFMYSFCPSFCCNYSSIPYGYNFPVYPRQPEPKLISHPSEPRPPKTDSPKKFTDHSIKSITGMI